MNYVTTGITTVPSFILSTVIVTSLVFPDFIGQRIGYIFQGTIAHAGEGFRGQVNATLRPLTTRLTQLEEAYHSMNATNAAQKLTNATENFLHHAQIAKPLVNKLHESARVLFDKIPDIAEDFAEVFRDASSILSLSTAKAVEQAIYQIGGKALSALSWTVLPYVGLGLTVTVGTPLTISYFYLKAVHYIGSPKLATSVRQRTMLTPITDRVHEVGQILSQSPPSPTPIYHPEITKQINDLIESSRNTRNNNGYFQNILFYGPGGTGKTMVSQWIAKNSGMSYIQMSGGDLAQYIKRGEHVSELNKLMDKLELSWRPWSTRPWILFIDEAESLCKDRSKIQTAELLELQNAFLSRTGVQSKRFMLILATNRMEDLDEAILSRMDHKIFIGPPEKEERARIIISYLPQFFSATERKEFFTDKQIDLLAQATKGFTGRGLFKMLNAMSGKKMAAKDGKLTQPMIRQIVKRFIDQEIEVTKRREAQENLPL